VTKSVSGAKPGDCWRSLARSPALNRTNGWRSGLQILSTIKLRGRRINLDEIEQVVRQTGLAGMVCAWVDDSANAQELHVAYTTPGHDSLPASGLKLRLLMSRYLPAFAMPNHLYPFNGAFPLNGNGKPDLSTIKKQVEGE